MTQIQYDAQNPMSTKSKIIHFGFWRPFWIYDSHCNTASELYFNFIIFRGVFESNLELLTPIEIFILKVHCKNILFKWTPVSVGSQITQSIFALTFLLFIVVGGSSWCCWKAEYQALSIAFKGIL